MNTTMLSRYPSIIVVMATGYNNSNISENSEVSSVYTCFVCGVDGHLSSFCSQMQSLADHGPNNNMLYPHGLPPLVNNYSHEQDVQAVAHHVENGNRLCTQPPVNIMK